MITHRIQRQCIEVHLYGTEQHGYAVQNVVREWSLTILPQMLERAFAPYENGRTVHIIEHVNLDLGAIELQDLVSRLTSLVQDKLDSVLTETVSKQANGLYHGDKNVHEDTRSHIGTEDAVSLDQHAARHRAILYFFIHGRLPWWFPRESAVSIEEMLRIDVSTEQLPAHRSYRELLRELHGTLESNSAARQRMMMQLSPLSALRLIQNMIPPLRSLISNALDASGKPPISRNHQEKLRAGLVQIVLRSIGEGRTAELTTQASTDTIIQSAVRSQRASLMPDEQRNILTQLGLDRNQAVLHSDVMARDISAQVPDELRFSEDADVFNRDGFLIRNAGIVLLHPFLPQYLRATHVAVNDELRDVNRAMLLIHHLTTGALTADEDDLLFMKVLCGVPVEMPIERCTPITDDERDEAHILLRAVIQYWDALRTTTPDELRGNFLARIGRLDLRESEWLLRVERQNHDILLDHLPWGFSHVKLPWMDLLMQVEWQQ